MKEESKLNLMKKGWSEEELQKAEDIISSRQIFDKSRSAAHSNKILFWAIVLITIIGNALVSLVLIPLLLVLNKTAMDVFIVVIGLTFGFFFNFLLWDVEEHISKQHHIIALVIIPALAVANLYAVFAVTNAVNDVLKLTQARESPLSVIILYVVAFLLPYLWTLFIKKKQKGYT